MRYCVSALAALLIFAAGAASAAERLALVIGNGDYATAPLANPTNDARLVADALTDTGFQVTQIENAGRREMQSAIREFSEAVAAAGRDAVALFYFAGHGVQVKGRNYLVPIGAELRSAADMEYEALDAQWALDLIGESRAGVSIIVLDACRNNPFRAISRAASRGLAQMDAPRGSILAYSTSPGQVALDGDGDSSPYSGALAQAIRKPGLRIEDVFKQVRRQVLIETGQKQLTWETSSLVGDFYFSGEALAALPPADAPASPVIEDGDVFADCDDCPSMVAIPGGDIAMGSSPDEAGHVDLEGPAVDVEVADFALAETEVTVGQFRQFLEESGHTPASDAGCWHWALTWLWDPGRHWDAPGYEIDDDHPVPCVNWHDARAYAEWLSEITGERYRLPTEAEWEYAAAAGDDGIWNDTLDEACEYANVYDQTAVAAFGAWFPTAGCEDGYAATVAAGTFPENDFGLRDMFGNLQEWTADCWNPRHVNRPARQTARQDGDCNKRVFKGGHFASPIQLNRPPARLDGIADHPNAYTGFRVARDLD